MLGTPGGSALNRDELLSRVKEAVRDMEPDAEIILYGSQSRGEGLSQSDWDFLVLVDGPVNDERTDAIRHRLYEIEWECGQVLSSIVRNRREWNSRPYCDTPFHRSVQQDRIVL